MCIRDSYRIAQQGYITRKFYGENATKKETVVVSSTAEKDPENNNDKTGKSTKKLEQPGTKPSSSSEAKRKRTTAGSNENHSHLHKEKPSKIEKKEKKTKEIKKEKNVKNSPIEENRMQTGRVTPSGTNIPRSQKKRKKKKRK